jgi:hypothetical protein
MDVLRRDDGIVAVVLDLGKSLDDITLMVIIDKYNGPDDFLPGLPFRLNQAVTDQVPNGFGSCRALFPLDFLVELIHQSLVERYTESDYGHLTLIE